jgi:hypothetical protein
MLCSLCLFLSSCNISLGGSNSVSSTVSVYGKAVNVRASSDSTSWYKDSTLSLVGSLVTISKIGGYTSKTTTVGSAGTYAFSGIEPGRYKISAVQTGWAFVPRNVEISGYASELPDLLGYIIPGDLSEILIITEWQNASIDVDSHMIIDTSNADALAGGATGTTFDVCWSAPTYSSSVTLERDITPLKIAAGQPAVETVRISTNPFASTDGTGWLRFYLNAASGSGTLTGNSYASIAEAQATVHVMQGAEHYGSFSLATETQETTLLVLKMSVTRSGTITTYSIMSGGNFGDGVYRSLGE